MAKTMTTNDEIGWEQTGGEGPGMTSPVLDLPEGFGLVMGMPHAALWVKAPPELGGGKLYIQGTWWLDMRCPIGNCNAQGPLQVVDLEQNLSVLCCRSCGQYGWTRTSQLKGKINEQEGAAETKDDTEAGDDEGGV